MWMPVFVKSLSLLPARPVGPVPREAPLKAVRLLEAEGLLEARTRAGQALAGARRCACCRNLLAHLFDRLGSTLFLDDDPEQLAQVFEEDERDLFTPRVLAACIVLFGRERTAPGV